MNNNISSSLWSVFDILFYQYIKSYPLDDPQNLKYDERTEIWVKPANLVQTMLADIAEERDAENTRFSIFGLDFFLAMAETIAAHGQEKN